MYKLQDAAYQNVTLGPSHWEGQRRDTMELYLNIPNDDLLHITRVAAGIESNANGLTGWYGVDGPISPVFGQQLGAYAKLYACTGDYRMKEKAVYLADELGKCFDKNPELLHSWIYAYEKLIGGFLDLYEYMGYEKAKEYVSKMTDCAMEDFDRTIKRDGLQDKNVTVSMIEWYTLPEQLYRAYQLFGDEKYKEFAREWDYPYFWEKLINGDFKSIGPRHAYSHVNALSSAARAYMVTGDEMYMDAMKAAYDEITRHHTYATGGYGPGETMFAERESYLGDVLKSPYDVDHKGDPMYVNMGDKRVTRADPWGSCEVSCCTWGVFKFCNYMLKLTGGAKYGDWVEKMLVNGTGGQILPTQDGKILYFASYFEDGAVKSNDDRRLHLNGVNNQWQCCTGTWPQDMAEYANILYYCDDSGVYVSQYLPSTYSWNAKGKPVTIENYSDYPNNETLKFCVSTSGEEVDFALRFRVPAWAKGKNQITVNGTAIDVDIVPNQWAVVNRTWSDGNIVEITYPYSLYFRSVDEYTPELVALSYGPVVLACTEMTLLVGDRNNPQEWIKPVEGEPFTFRTEPGHTGFYPHLTRTFVPYYKVGEMQWYYMYNRIYDKDPGNIRL